LNVTLGVDGLARFLRLHRSGPGDYAKDRLQWQQDLTVDEILESIKRHLHGWLRQNCAKTPSIWTAGICCLSESSFPKLISGTFVWNQWTVWNREYPS